MTEREFAYWLSGYIAIGNSADLSEEQIKYIKKTIRRELPQSEFGKKIRATLDSPELLVKQLQEQLQTEEEVPQKANPFKGTARRFRRGLRVFNEMLVPETERE